MNSQKFLKILEKVSVHYSFMFFVESDDKPNVADAIWFEEREYVETWFGFSYEVKVKKRYKAVDYFIYPGYEKNAKSGSGYDLALIKFKGKPSERFLPWETFCKM